MADFQKEARAVLGEYNKVNDWSYICLQGLMLLTLALVSRRGLLQCASDPELLLEETMQDKAFKCHTYKHTTLGFLEDIKVRTYRPQNLRLSS